MHTLAHSVHVHSVTCTELCTAICAPHVASKNDFRLLVRKCPRPLLLLEKAALLLLLTLFCCVHAQLIMAWSSPCMRGNDQHQHARTTVLLCACISFGLSGSMHTRMSTNACCMLRVVIARWVLQFSCWRDVMPLPIERLLHGCWLLSCLRLLSGVYVAYSRTQQREHMRTRLPGRKWERVSFNGFSSKQFGARRCTESHANFLHGEPRCAWRSSTPRLGQL